MIISAYSPQSYAGNGVTTVFSTGFVFQLPTDVVVKLLNNTTGTLTPLVNGTDYTLTGGGFPANVGTVTTTSAPASGFTLELTRAVPITQGTTWQQNDAYPANAFRIENALDKLTMLFQQSLGGLIPPAQLGLGSATSATFLRGDSQWANVLIGVQGAAAAGTDSITVMTVEQNAQAAFRVTSGAGQQASYYFGQGGSANPFEMRLTYDPTLGAVGFAGTGPLHQLFYANGDVDWSGFNYNFAAGSVTIGGRYYGNADGSLITSGQVLPQYLASNAPNSLFFLCGDGTWKAVSGGGGGATTTTTAPFTIAAINSTQTVAVATGLPIGTFVYISDGTHTIIGQITGIASLNLTVKTSQIIAGTAGNTMASGAAVAINSVPGANSVLTQDAGTGATSTTTFSLSGQTSGIPSSGYNVDLYIAASAAGTLTLKGYTNANLLTSNISAPTTSVKDRLVYIPQGQITGALLPLGSAGTVLQSTGPTLAYALIGAANVTANSLTPALMLATNSPSAGLALTYSDAGHYTWASAGGLPPPSDDSQFLRGDATYSNVINMVTGLGGLVWAGAETTNTVGTYIGLVGSVIGPPTGFDTFLDFAPVKKGVSAWNAAGKTVFNFAGPLAVNMGATHAVYNSIDSSNVEIGQFCQPFSPMTGTSLPFTTNIFRADGFRSGAGYWQYAYTVTAPASSLTIDIKNGTYQRHNGIANNVTVTLTDSTAAPTTGGWQFANELTLEINAPGSFTYTWPGTVTWANNQSAPTLSTTGVNVLKFIRRQGQTLWIGYVVNQSGGSSYTNAQAQDAVGGILSNAGTIQFAYTSHTSITGTVPALAITNAMLQGNIQPAKILGYPSNSGLFLNGGGTWTALASANTAPYNVRLSPYNASGNGVTDDTTAIQNAINDAVAAGGGTVYLPAGTYKITASLTMGNGVNLQGVGIARRDPSVFPIYVPTRILWGGAGGGTMVSVSGLIGGMKWDSIHFDGASSAAIGWYFESVTFSTFSHCEIINCTSYGVKIAVPTASNNDATGNTFSNIAINCATATCLYLSSTGAGANACHNTFSNLWLVHGNRAIEMGWCDNNAFLQVFCFRAAGTNYDIYLRGNYPVSGVGAVGNRFYQLEGEVEAEATTSGSPFYNEVYGYDQDNGQRYPLIHANAILTMFGIGVVAETLSGHSNFAAITLTTGQAICLAPPTAANTGVYIVDNGTHLRATRDGGNTWTNII